MTVPSGPAIVTAPPVPSNVVENVTRLTAGSTGIVKVVSSARVPPAHSSKTLSDRVASAMTTDMFTNSAGLMGNGCPPVSEAVFTYAASRGPQTPGPNVRRCACASLVNVRPTRIAANAWVRCKGPDPSIRLIAVATASPRRAPGPCGRCRSAPNRSTTPGSCRRG